MKSILLTATFLLIVITWQAAGQAVVTSDSAETGVQYEHFDGNDCLNSISL